YRKTSILSRKRKDQPCWRTNFMRTKSSSELGGIGYPYCWVGSSSWQASSCWHGRCSPIKLLPLTGAVQEGRRVLQRWPNQGKELLVRMGLVTKQESDQGMQSIRNWSQATLDQHVTNWFLEH